MWYWLFKYIFMGPVLTLLGRPPVIADSVRYDRLRFDVTAVKGHGVEEAAVTLFRT